MLHFLLYLHSNRILINKMRIIITFLFTVVFCINTNAQWNTKNILQMGKSDIILDDYVGAIGRFNDVIRIKPYLSEPYFFRGLAKLNLEDYDGAIRDFSKSIELSPNYFHAYVYRGIAYNGQKKYDKAMSDYQKAIMLDPGNAHVYACRAVTYSEINENKLAEKDYSKALLINDKMAFVYFNRAILRDKIGDEKGAMLDCNSAISLNVFSDDAYALRGYMFYKKKDYYNAIDDYNRALKSNNKNLKVLMGRAIVWYETKQFKKALDDYKSIISLEPNYVYAYFNRAILLSDIGEYRAAIRDLNKIVEINPNNILVYFNRALMKLKINDLNGAYYDVTESIKLYPDFVKAYILRASIYSKINKPNEAYADNTKAKEIMHRYKKMKEGDASYFVDTTSNFRRLVDINAGRDVVRNSLNARVQDRDVGVKLKDIFFVAYYPIDSIRSGKIRYYSTNMLNFNQRHSYNPAIGLSNKTNVLSDSLTTANIKLYTNMIEHQKDNSSYFIRGLFYLDKQEFYNAIEDFSKVDYKNPDYLMALFNQANAKVLMSDYIQKIEDKSGVSVGLKNKPKEYVDYSEALMSYERCIQSDSTFVYALYNIATLYAKNEKIDKAISIYNDVIDKDSSLAEAYFNRGLLYIYKGNKKLANADLSKAGELGITEAYNIIKRYCRIVN